MKNVFRWGCAMLAALVLVAHAMLPLAQADFALNNNNGFGFSGYMDANGCTHQTIFNSNSSAFLGKVLNNWEFDLNIEVPNANCAGSTNLAKLGGGCWAVSGGQPKTRVTYYDSGVGGIGYGYYPVTGWASPYTSAIRCFDRNSTGDGVNDYSVTGISTATQRRTMCDPLTYWINTNALFIGSTKTLISYEVEICVTNLIMKQISDNVSCCTGNYDGQLKFTFFFDTTAQTSSNLPVTSATVTAINRDCSG